MTFAFFLLNFIQAISEFLPISSSGHLIIVEWLYNISEQGLEAFLHLPTALAILVVFWSSFWIILKQKKTWPMLLAAIIPAGIIGLVFGDYIDAIFYSPLVVGINQIFWGIVLTYTATNRKVISMPGKKWTELSWVEGLKIGLMQILALIPGTSRSGITTLAGISQGVAPQESAAFSFIAGFPLIAAASGVGFLKLIKAGQLLSFGSPLMLILGMAMSLVLGILFMKLFTSKHTLTVMKYSGVYRIILGILILVWLS